MCVPLNLCTVRIKEKEKNEKCDPRIRWKSAQNYLQIWSLVFCFDLKIFVILMNILKT